MCGIAGFLAYTGEPPAAAMRPRLDTAAMRMAARGPDGNGLFESGAVGLAHRRLAVIDPAGGQQPLVDPVTGAVLVFNGEIYNHRELRARLEALGRVFQSRCDTEVLLQAWLAWGDASLTELDGMFAFAVYDPADGSLFLARDRLGVKPLYVHNAGGVFAFASSLHALNALLPERPSVNLAALSHYLSTVRTNLGEQTLAEGVRLVEPGSWLRVSAAGADARGRYWRPACPAATARAPVTMESAAAHLRAGLGDAVRKRLISDVPLGGFLSGGLDSTVIAALASSQTGGAYHAYTVGYARDGYHEFPYAREAAARYGMQCREIVLADHDYPALWQHLIRANGLPLSTPNEVPIYMLAQALRQDYTVALSGEGADEILGGYTIADFAGHDYRMAARQPVPADRMTPADQAIMRAYGQPYLPDPATQHLLLNCWMTAAEKRAWLHPDVVAELDDDHAMRAWYQALYGQYPEADIMDRIMLAHLRVNLEGLLLRVDSSTMAASVEARVPFTDHRLVDLAFSLPPDLRLDWRSPAARAAGETLNVLEIVQRDLVASKRVLRAAFADAVPAAVLNRPKMSFPVPVFEWIEGWMRPLVAEILASSPLRGTVFNAAMLDAWIGGQVAVHPMKVWPVVNLCLWASVGW